MKVASTHCTPLRSGSTSIPPPWQGREVLGEIVGLLAWSFCPGWLGDQGWYITVSLERLPLISPANSSTLSCGYQAPCPVDILQPNLSLCHLEFNKASKDYKHFIITRNHSKWVLEAKTLVSFVTHLHNELMNKSIMTLFFHFQWIWAFSLKLRSYSSEHWRILASIHMNDDI